MTTQNQKVLIVDDKKENIAAAKKYFETRKEISLDISMDYSNALENIRNTKYYSAAILDLELPFVKGAIIKKFGVDLAKEATKYVIPSWAILTSGIDHHNCKSAFVSYFFDPLIKHGERKFSEITETPKTDPRAWKDVYETMVGERELSISVSENDEKKEGWFQILKLMQFFRQPPFTGEDEKALYINWLEKYEKENGKRLILEDSLVDKLFIGHKLLGIA